MECKIYRETATNYIYAVNNAFYLVIPKLRVKPSIEVIIDDNIKENLDMYFKTTNIGVIRVYAANYFADMSDDVSKHKLKSIINADISIVKQILDKNKIEFEDRIIINTKFSGFKDWFINENTRQDVDKGNDRVEELLALKEEYLAKKDGINSSSSISNSKKKRDKVKSLSNGHSLLNYSFEDGFTNVVFLSIVTIITSLICIIYMLSQIMTI